MNFLHVADLHVGKKLCGKSLVEDQRHMLAQIVAMTARPDVDALLVAGDLYDKAQPSSEAVELVGGFLSALAALQKPCFIVSGNHDSAEQVAYCAQILSGAKIYVSPAFTGAPQRRVLRDAYGEIHLYLLPFIRPMAVRRAFPERAAEISGYADALRVAVESIAPDPGVRNLLVAHQFVVGGEPPELSQSEERMIGGVDAVPAGLFAGFDYVALGHLHAPQRAGSARVRYAGSPLKYSASEVAQRKAAIRLTLGPKAAEPEIQYLPYAPLHDVRRIRGTLAELTRGDAPDMDYIFAALTDETPPLDPLGALLMSYPNLAAMRFENSRSGADAAPIAVENVEERTPIEHFTRFFEMQNNWQPPSAAQLKLMKQIIAEAEASLHAAD